MLDRACPITLSPLAWSRTQYPDPLPLFAQSILTWRELVAWLAQLAATTSVPVKDAIPLVQYAHTTGPDDAHVPADGLHALSLDYDGCTPEQFAHALAAAQALGVAWFGYTSYRHRAYVDPKRPGDTERFRLVFPLAAPCPPARVKAYTTALANLVGQFNSHAPGHSERNPARRWYLPAINPASGSCWFDGACMDRPFLDLASLPAAPAAPAAPRPSAIVDELDCDQSQLVDAADLVKLAKRLRAIDARPDLQRVGQQIDRMVRGEPFAPKGERGAALVPITGEIADAYPFANADHLASLLEASLWSEGEPTDDFAAMLRRQQAKKQAEHAAKREAAELHAAVRAKPLEQIAPAPAATSVAVPDGWPVILQKATRFWLRRMNATTFDMLRGAEELGGELLKTYASAIRCSDDTGKLLPLARILADYGQVLEQVAYDYSATSNSWDPGTNTLTLVSARRRALTAQFSPDVDRWLRTLAGDSYALVEQWLAGVLHLDRPSPALYLWGERGCGKSFLALAIADLWETPGGSLEDAMSDFNASLKNPVVVADEHLPQRMSFADVRDFVTRSTRYVNEKYGAKLPLHGCVRLVLTANNADVLRMPRNDAHTEDDARAISQRVLRVRVGSTAGDVLRSFDTHQWLRDHTVARHVLWLHERVAISAGRFVVDSDNPAIVSELAAARYGWLIEWLCDYLDDPRAIEARYALPGARWLVRVHDGSLLVHPAALTELGGQEVSRKDKIERDKALAYFKSGRKRLRDGRGEQRIDYWEIDLVKLLTARGGSPDLAFATLAANTETRVG